LHFFNGQLCIFDEGDMGGLIRNFFFSSKWPFAVSKFCIIERKFFDKQKFRDAVAVCFLAMMPLLV